jgi:hypothetical protein
MGEGRGPLGGPKTAGVLVALCCVIAALCVAKAIGGSDQDPPLSAAYGAVSSSGAAPQESPISSDAPDSVPADWVSTNERVLRHEALPCTGPREPINFEIFSAGPAVEGLPMNAAVRRCDVAAPKDEKPANYLTYVYGYCETPAKDDQGCAPPLQIQTWPACQRNKAGYSFDGKPVPSREIPPKGGAMVTEFKLAGESRLEVYTKSSTVVIFAERPELAKKAIEFLRPQKTGNPPATRADDLRGSTPKELPPPTDGASEGRLQCQP